jgi:hypothetical protein
MDPPTWFERVEASSHQISTNASSGATTPPGLQQQPEVSGHPEIPLRSLLTLCDDALSGYSILYSKGWVAKVLMDDFRGNIAKVEKVCRELEEGNTSPATVTGLLTRAVSRPGGLHGDDGVWGVLWCARTLRFVAELLRALGADPDLPISSAGRQTYQKTLAAYHAPVFGWVVGIIVGIAPSRSWVLSHTLAGMTNKTVTDGCARTSAALTPIPTALIAQLAAAGADFPDKQSALPFGL